jgi:hypothetical protein
MEIRRDAAQFTERRATGLDLSLLGRMGTIWGHHNTPPHATQHSGSPCGSVLPTGRTKSLVWAGLGTRPANKARLRGPGLGCTAC